MAGEVPILTAFQIHDPYVQQTIVDTVIQFSHVLNLLPFINVDTGFAAGWLEKAQNGSSGINFRALNDDYANAYNALAPYRESIKPLGTSVRVDHLVEEQYPGTLQNQLRIHLQDLGWAIDNYFINGDTAVSEKQFDGLAKKLGTVAGDHVVDNGGTLEIDTSATTYKAFLRLWDKAMDRINGTPNFAYMAPGIYNAITAGAREMGANVLGSAIDFLGRKVVTLQDVPLYKLNKDHNGTSIFPFTETGSTTSIYMGIMNEDRGVAGLSAKGVQLLPDNGGIFWRTVIDFTMGLKAVTNSIVRIQKLDAVGY